MIEESFVHSSQCCSKSCTDSMATVKTQEQSKSARQKKWCKRRYFILQSPGHWCPLVSPYWQHGIPRNFSEMHSPRPVPDLLSNLNRHGHELHRKFLCMLKFGKCNSSPPGIKPAQHQQSLQTEQWLPHTFPSWDVITQRRPCKILLATHGGPHCHLAACL